MSPFVTKTERVMATIRDQIETHVYRPGMRLPSIRSQARRANVSTSTVVDAYERLVAEGLIYARPGAGFFVAGSMMPLALSRLAPALERDVDPLWVSRQSLTITDADFKPGCGWLPADWLYQTGIRKGLRSVARDHGTLLADYATPLGAIRMREWLARRMADYHIQAVPDQIILADSGTQAIDMICRIRLSPGDTVLVDDPCYFNFHALLRAHQVQVVGVPMTPSGPDLCAFEQALKTHHPRLYLTNSAIHNPTGATLSATVAHQLLTHAETHDLLIVEDDIFADFEHSPAPRLAALDGLNRVIYMGSFSKTLSASVRCGYIAASAEWIESLLDLKIATHFGSGHLAAEVVCTALMDAGYRRHLEKVRQQLATVMDRTLHRLTDLGMTPWLVPSAGMFVWCELPPEINAVALSQAALREGVVLAPGNVFSTEGRADHYLRFNVAQSDDARLFEQLKRLMASVSAA